MAHLLMARGLCSTAPCTNRILSSAWGASPRIRPRDSPAGGRSLPPGWPPRKQWGNSTGGACIIHRKEVLGVRDNPMRERIDRIARMAGLTAIVNVVLDGQGRIVRCFTGDPVEAHRAGSVLAAQLYRVAVDTPETAGIFLIDTHPLDQDLWQGVKAMCALECIVPDGAVIIVVTPCPEGVSRQHPDVLATGYLGLAATTELVKAGRLDKVTAHNIVQGGRLVERTQAFMVSPGIADDDIRRLGFTPFASVQDALNEAIRRKGTSCPRDRSGDGGRDLSGGRVTSCLTSEGKEHHDAADSRPLLSYVST